MVAGLETVLSLIGRRVGPSSGASHSSNAQQARARERVAAAVGEPSEVLRLLASSQVGLTHAEAEKRLRRWGPNALPHAPRTRWWQRLLRAFAGLFAVLLLVASVLAVVAGMPELGIAIVIVVVVNGVFAFVQEYRAERAVQSLESMLPDRVLVRRSTRDTEVPAHAVVPGDILLLREGALVPADARIIRAERLRVDLSALTGESRPVARVAHGMEAADRSMAALHNLVFAGTTVSKGADAMSYCARTRPSARARPCMWFHSRSARLTMCPMSRNVSSDFTT